MRSTFNCLRASMRSSLLLLLAAAGLLVASVSSLSVPGLTPVEQGPEQCTKFVTDLEQCLQTLSKGHQALRACTNHQIRCADGLQLPLRWMGWMGIAGAAVVLLFVVPLASLALGFRSKYLAAIQENKQILNNLSSHQRALKAASAESCQFANDLLARISNQGGGTASQPSQQNGPVPAMAAATPAAARGTPAPATPTSAAPAASPTAAAASQQLTPGTPSNTPVAGGGPSPSRMAPDGSTFVTQKDLETALLRVENKHLEKELLLRDLVLAASPGSTGRSPPGGMQATPAPPHVGMVRGGYGMPSPLAGATSSNSPGFSSSLGGLGGFGRGSPLMPPSAAAGAGPGSVGSPAGSYRGRPSPPQAPSAPGSAASSAPYGAKDAAGGAAGSRSRLGNSGGGAAAALGRDFQQELEAASANGGSPAAAAHAALQPPSHSPAAAWSPAPSASPAAGSPAVYSSMGMGMAPAPGASAGGGSSPGLMLPGKASSSPAQPFMPMSMPQRQGSGPPTSSPPPMGMPPPPAGGSPSLFPAPPRHPAV